MKLITVEQFRREVRAGKPPSGAVLRVSAEEPVEVAGADRTLRYCFSDDRVDLMGDTIDAAGWDLADFERNPVALWAHDSSAPPIGGARNVGVEGRRLMGDIEYASADVYPFADTIYRLARAKFIRAVSVGFIPIKYRFCDSDEDRGTGIDFLEQSLLEISVCPVPANPNALAEARRKGIDTRPLMEWAEKALEGGGKVVLPRAELERLRKLAKEPETVARRVARVRRADGAGEDDQTSGGDVVGNCGRKPDDTCGMSDPAECSVHCGVRAEGDADEKRLRGMLVRLLRRKDADADGDVPVAHEDAIRLAHKSLGTAKAFMDEAKSFHAKAFGLLDDVVGALDDKAVDEDGNDDAAAAGAAGDDTAAKAAQLKRAAALQAKFGR